MDSPELDLSRRRTLQGLAAGVGAAATAGVGAAQDDGPTIETVASFQAPNLPENIAIDTEGTHYLSMAPTGRVVSLTEGGDQSTVATLPTGDGFMLGIVIDDDSGDLFVAMASGSPDTHGVWRVPQDGEPERIAALNQRETSPNGIVYDALGQGELLVTDHTGGRIYRVNPGAGTAEVWLDHPLLDPNPYAAAMVGVDGIAAHPDGSVVVDNLDFGAVLSVPVQQGGAAGEPEVLVQTDGLVGADGMTTDEDGNVYVAVNAQNKISRVDAEGNVQTLASGDQFHSPADVHFGRTEQTRSSLYVANFALAAFQAEDQTPQPGYLRIDTDARGFEPE